jgi:hypothetical protein
VPHVRILPLIDIVLFAFALLGPWAGSHPERRLVFKLGPVSAGYVLGEVDVDRFLSNYFLFFDFFNAPVLHTHILFIYQRKVRLTRQFSLSLSRRVRLLHDSNLRQYKVKN